MKQTIHTSCILIFCGIGLSCNLEKIELGDVPTATFERHFGGAMATIPLPPLNFLTVILSWLVMEVMN